MQRTALLAFLLLMAAPAAAQQCADKAKFMKGATDNGYETIVEAKDDDGDKIVILLNPVTAKWLVIYEPQTAPDVVCYGGGGSEFKVKLGKGV